MSNKKLAVINVVGLTQALVNECTPFLYSLLQKKTLKPLKGAFPAVTTTAQSAMLTGQLANAHGIVGNGWYFPDLAEVGFWKQANCLVQTDKIWDVLKRQHPDFTCANSFWWYNMYAAVEYSMTPRPHYPADGRKIPDLYSYPSDMHKKIEQSIGKFPFLNFWGPKAGIESSQWIANAAVELQRKYHPNLHLIYLPHLDYNLQRLGPSHPGIKEDLRKIDKVVETLCHQMMLLDTEFIIVSEYGIVDVSRPVYINRILREAGYISVRNSLGYELLDCGASKAFAVADHQVAHIYINDKSEIPAVRALLKKCNGIDKVLGETGKAHYQINHQRAGDLVAVSDANAWFSYYYWMSDDKAPDFARTIDIHRKPGYDPVEMFIDPDNKFITLKILWKLLLKNLGFRSLFNVIPLKPQLIRGSHGRCDDRPDHWPIIIATEKQIANCENQTDVFTVIKEYFNDRD